MNSIAFIGIWQMVLVLAPLGPLGLFFFFILGIPS